MSESHNETRLSRVFPVVLTTKSRIHASIYFRDLGTKAIVNFVIFYTSRQNWTQKPRTISVSSSDSQPSHFQNLTLSKKNMLLDELLKLSKNGALNYGDMKSMTCWLSRAARSAVYRSTIKKALRKRWFKLWIWPQTSQWTEKLTFKMLSKGTRRHL